MLEEDSGCKKVGSVRHNMSKISFIIPAHNAEETITRTVLSIEQLGLDSEILIVENGSSDHTKEISDKLSNKHCNIHVFTSGKGVSKARNKGIENASGQWVVFVDADDESLNGLTKIKDYLDKGNVDIIIGGYKKDADLIIHDYVDMDVPIDVDDSVKVWMLSRPTLRMQAWAKVFRKDFLLQNVLFFNELLTYSEDSEFVLRSLKCAKKVIVTKELLYQYNTGTTSAMRGLVQGRVDAYIEALYAAERDVSDESQLVKNAFADYVIAHINIIGVHDIFGCEINESWKLKCQKMKELLNQDVFRNAIHLTNVRSNHHAVPVVLCKHHLVGLGGLIYYVRSLLNKRRSEKASESMRSGT